MAERDLSYYHLLDFEKKVKKLRIEFCYADKRNRKLTLTLNDHVYLLEQYANEAYNINSQGIVDPVYHRIGLEAEKLIRGDSGFSFEFKKKRNGKIQEYNTPDCIALTISTYLRRYIIKFKSLLNLSDNGESMMVYYHKTKSFKLEREFLDGSELSWGVGIAFFMLMKINEVLNAYGYDLV